MLQNVITRSLEFVYYVYVLLVVPFFSWNIDPIFLTPFILCVLILNILYFLLFRQYYLLSEFITEESHRRNMFSYFVLMYMSAMQFERWFHVE